MIAIDDRTALAFKISPGQAHDAPAGRDLIRGLAGGPQEAQGSPAGGPQEARRCLVMDRAYEGDETRKAAEEAGFTPVVPPKKTARINGNTTKRSTNSETRSSGCSAA